MKKIKEKLENYFYDNTIKGEHFVFLKVLDNHPNKHYYTGVTIDYIIQFVLEGKYPLEEAVMVIIELIKEKTILPFVCNTINRVVFQPYKGKYTYRISKVNNYLEAIEKRLLHNTKCLNDILKDGKTEKGDRDYQVWNMLLDAFGITEKRLYEEFENYQILYFAPNKLEIAKERARADLDLFINYRE